MKYIIGNWKMNVDADLVSSFNKSFKKADLNNKAVFGLAVPAIFVDDMKKSLSKINCLVGTQNVSEHERGAFTGEISAKMLKDKGVNFCIVGHSERRAMYGDTNEVVNGKLNRLLECEITPLLCVGETLTEYEKGITKDVLKTQLINSLKNIEPKKLAGLIVAYEPVWAIGTGKTATNQEIKNCVEYILEILNSILGKNKIPVLYGGSVKANNAKDILSIPNVSGALIGGASLNVESFLEIANSIK